MADARPCVRQHARPALAAPVERGHVPPPRAPVDQAFQIFLEIIRPPSSEQERAPAAGLWAQPQRAYPAAVRRGPETGFGVIRQAAAGDRKSTSLNSSQQDASRKPYSARHKKSTQKQTTAETLLRS